MRTRMIRQRVEFIIKTYTRAYAIKIFARKAKSFKLNFTSCERYDFEVIIVCQNSFEERVFDDGFFEANPFVSCRLSVKVVMVYEFQFSRTSSTLSWLLVFVYTFGTRTNESSPPERSSSR